MRTKDYVDTSPPFKATFVGTVTMDTELMQLIYDKIREWTGEEYKLGQWFQIAGYDEEHQNCQDFAQDLIEAMGLTFNEELRGHDTY